MVEAVRFYRPFKTLQEKSMYKKSMKIFKKTVIPLIVQLLALVRIIIDRIIDFCFSLYYDDTKKIAVPEAKTSLLMESALSLAKKIRNKEITSEEVVRCFVERIQEVNPILNAVVDTRFEEALTEAKEVDKILCSETASDVEQNKPFLGVPFTTKDSTACKGLLHTMGIVSRSDVKATEDADVVALMKNAGAILLAVTNVPELNLWSETRNNVIGQTKNPYDTRRSVGGSSGGEASLIAAAASPLGIGTDIGGSIRIPACCCGIFGHKPTTGLTPLKGLTFRTGEEGQTMVTAGPMTKYACDLKPFLKVLLGGNVSRLRLDLKVNLKDLKVMYMEELNDPRTSFVTEDIKVALQRATDYFQEISHNIEKVKFAHMKYSFTLWKYWMSREPTNFAADLANRKGSLSPWIELPKKLCGCSQFTLAAIIGLVNSQLPPVNKKWAETVTAELKEEVCEVLGENGILLIPSQPTTAGYHYTAFLRPFNFMYCGIFNVLKLPVTQVPVGLGRDGLPIGIQVVAAPYNDHLCLAVAEELEKAFHGWVPPFPTKP
ncbi:fatty-acid amide hydrolase 2 isoform X1 [Schistocerca americana]|uniref:fatty-acid amide hydrolase 2 isoform X1 n=1 Tax=Schistocerca americana TaxID=7009 RepID=UPI001F4FD03A|nr:fatty-acid amide hydrolase 2 isoform X1 [Schistocerca americana]